MAAFLDVCAEPRLAYVTVTGGRDAAANLFVDNVSFADKSFDFAVPTFTDVTSETPFANEIAWIAEQGITTGYLNGDGTRQYQPTAPVARDAMAAFLYRMAGEPTYTAPAQSPFADVPTTHKFYKEITWLHDEGISTGWKVGDTREFRPAQNITRDAMAAFMYRYAGPIGYEAPAEAAFLDVAANSPFYKEISWMHDAHLSNGWAVDGGAEYRPSTNINRDAMAAFMYRYQNVPMP